MDHISFSFLECYIMICQPGLDLNTTALAWPTRGLEYPQARLQADVYRLAKVSLGSGQGLLIEAMELYRNKEEYNYYNVSMLSGSLNTVSSRRVSHVSTWSSSVSRLSSENSAFLSNSGSTAEDGRGSGKISSLLIEHLRNWTASTMSPFRRQHCLLIVIPPCENAHSLETEDAMIAR